MVDVVILSVITEYYDYLSLCSVIRFFIHVARVFYYATYYVMFSSYMFVCDESCIGYFRGYS
jgi:hypothetical protein